MREIKFRAWDNKSNQMFYSSDAKHFDENSGREYFPFVFEIGFKGRRDFEIMQYTGHNLFDGRECYEGDIAFDEVSQENGDDRLYFACTWVKEFGGFCWLHLPGEYNEYLDCGIEHFDESMRNSYNMEDTDKLHYAGNIYEHRHLLK